VLRIKTKLAVCWIVVGISAWGQAGSSASADISAKAAAYEVVSIKPTEPGARGGEWRSPPDGFRFRNMPLSSLIYSAYGIIMDSQVSGMPEWAESDRYDVEAKVDADTAEAWKNLSWKERWKQEQPMIQLLLADRCHLKVHRETKELPVYDLIIAKGGLKMKEAAANEAGTESMGGGTMIVRAQTIESIVYGFAGTDGRLIVDKTGLGEKKFDFELKWTPDNRRNADDAADAGPSIFTALEEQLGLKLVPSKGPVDVLVIDHIEKPSAN
jgi:uncharacterized protein (TIGR03435 family)